MKTYKHTIFMIALILFVASGAYAQTCGSEMTKPAQMKEQTLDVKTDYPLDYCIVKGSKLGSDGEPIMYNHMGREIQFCCNGCVSKFEKDPETYLAKLDAAILSEQKENYPLETCVVTGEKLSSMGKSYDYVYNNQLVRFCCGGCVSTFEKNPDMYLKKLHSGYSEKMQ